MKREISNAFSNAFQEAGGQSVHLYSELIRFTALMFVVLGVLWCLQGFLDANARASDAFMVQVGSRLVKVVIGLMMFILLMQ